MAAVRFVGRYMGLCRGFRVYDERFRGLVIIEWLEYIRLGYGYQYQSYKVPDNKYDSEYVVMHYYGDMYGYDGRRIDGLPVDP